MLFVPIFGLTQGPSWCCLLISQLRWITTWRFLGIGRTYYGLAAPPSFGPSLRVKTSSVHVSGWEIPLTTRMRKCGRLVSSTQSGPMLLLVLISYLEASAGDWWQLLSLGPICLLPHGDTFHKRDPRHTVYWHSRQRILRLEPDITDL